MADEYAVNVWLGGELFTTDAIYPKSEAEALAEKVRHEVVDEEDASVVVVKLGDG